MNGELTVAKKKFSICITTTFNKWYEIEAESSKKALEMVQEEINNGEYDDAIDTDDFETEITAVNEIK